MSDIETVEGKPIARSKAREFSHFGDNVSISKDDGDEKILLIVGGRRMLLSVEEVTELHEVISATYQSWRKKSSWE